MVHILNGEIVPDDDPRVRAQQKQPQRPSQEPLSSRFGSVHNATNAPPRAPVTTVAAHPSPLQGLARQVGLEGSVTIPAVLGMPARPLQKIHVVVAALLSAVFGWRALVFLVFAYFLSTQQRRRT